MKEMLKYIKVLILWVLFLSHAEQCSTFAKNNE